MTRSEFDAPAVFRAHIQNNVRYALKQAPSAKDPPPPAHARAQMLLALDYAMALPEIWPLTRALVLKLAPKMEQVGYRQEWIGYLQRALEQSKQANDIASEAALRMHLGELYRMMARFELAQKEIEQSLHLFKRLGDERGAAQALNRLAFLLRQQNDLENAQRLAEQALSLVAEGDEEQGYAYFVLGNVKTSQRAWSEAADYYRQALAIWRKTSNPRYLGWAHSNLASALIRKGDYEAAQQHMAIAIEHLHSCNDARNLAITTMNLGNLHLKQAQWDVALTHYMKARRVFRRTQDLISLAIVELNMGIAHRKLGRWSLAKAAYQSCIEMAARLGDAELQINAMTGLFKVHLAQGHDDLARAEYQKARALLPQIRETRSREHWRQELDSLANQLQERRRVFASRRKAR